MISDVDESLRSLIRRDALNGTDVEVVLDAPTKEWSARRNAPTLDMYLYDIREDLRRRENGLIDVYDEDGRVTGRVKPPRYYKLSYLVTAWTQRPEDEHRLLAAVLACFLRHDRLPDDVLVGQLAGVGLPIPVTIGLPPPEDRALSDVWSALGGELKPSLDLVVTSPFETGLSTATAPLVLEPLRLGLQGGEPGAGRRRNGTGGGGAAGGGDDADGAADTSGPAGRGGWGGHAGPPGDDITSDRSRRSRRHRGPAETVTGGTPEHPGRVFHVQNLDERSTEPGPELERGAEAAPPEPPTD